MNVDKPDSILEEIGRPMPLELMHLVEDLSWRKHIWRLADFEDIRLLDYLFVDGFYPIDEARDFRRLGDIFSET
jgi:hypothetical protein